MEITRFINKVIGFIKRTKICKTFDLFVGYDLKFLLSRKSYNEWKKLVQENERELVFIADFGGLADRLKTSVSMFWYCKKYNIKFKLLYNYPFNIRLYLEPNEYDWTVADEDPSDTSITSESINFTELEDRCTEEAHLFMHNFIVERIKNSNVKKLYFRMNQVTASLCKDFVFSELYNELFRPTRLVLKQLDYYNEKIIQWGGGVY